MRGTSVRGQGSSLQPEAGGPAGRGATAAAKQPGLPEGNEAPDTHEVELMTLLVELVRERGRTGAGEVLDLDPRTVASALKRRTLSRRVRTALERVSSGEGGQKGEPGALHTQLVARIEGLEREVLVIRELAPERERALRGAFNQDLRQLERRVARLELFVEPDAEGLATSEAHEPVVGGPAPWGAAPSPVPRRQYPDLVTREPAPDDAQVYGEAWPLVEEWRELWQVHERPGKGLAWLKREVRILELEVAMLEEHELTLPPATYPQRGLELHSHLGWRLQALANRRRARTWAQLGRWLRGGLVFALLAGVTTFMLLASASS